jgi:hypothetical protein
VTSSLIARSPLEAGVLTALAAMGIAGALGLVAVLDADGPGSAFGTGFGVAWSIALAGATIAAALACLRRSQHDAIALGSIVVAGLALDLLVLAILLDVDSEAYGKVTGVAFLWSFLALVVLGLTLAVGAVENLGRLLYLATIAVSILAGLVGTWLIGTAGDEDVPAVGPFDVVPGGAGADDELLRILGACFVVIAALWFATLAATRVELRGPSDVEPDV